MLQALVMAVGVVVAVTAARRATDERLVWWGAALAMAILPMPFPVRCSVILLLGGWLLLDPERGSTARTVLSGVCVGLAVLATPVVLAVAPIVWALAWAFPSGSDRVPTGRKVLAVTVAVGVFIGWPLFIARQGGGTVVGYWVELLALVSLGGAAAIGLVLLAGHRRPASSSADQDLVIRAILGEVDRDGASPDGDTADVLDP